MKLNIFSSCQFFPIVLHIFLELIRKLFIYSDFKPFVDYMCCKYIHNLWLTTFHAIFGQRVLKLKTVQFISFFFSWVVLVIWKDFVILWIWTSNTWRYPPRLYFGACIVLHSLYIHNPFETNFCICCAVGSPFPPH